MKPDLAPLPSLGMPSVENRFHSMDIELINYCANNCVFCCARDRPRERKRMSLTDLEILLDRVPGFAGNVTLSDTGDPLLLDDLAQKIALIRKHWPGCTINLTTTLSVPRDRDWFAAIFKAGLDQIMFSLYAFDEHDYERLQGSGKYRTVLENLKEIASIPGTAAKFWLREMANFNKVYPVENYEAKKNAFMDFYHSLGFSLTYPVMVLPVIPDSTEGEYWNAPVPCNVVWGERAGMCEIHADLDVVPCCLFPNDKVTFGNLRNSSLEDIYDSEAARDFRKKWWAMEQGGIPVCRRCKCYDMSVNDWEENDRIVHWQAERLRGREIICWGHGSAWRRYRSFFGNCKISGMIVQDDVDSASGIDGIQQLKPSVLSDPAYAQIPLVIFALRKNAVKILTCIHENFDRSIKNIFVCPPYYAIRIDGASFYYDKL